MTGNLSPEDNWMHHVLMKLSTETCLSQRLLLSTKYTASHDGNPLKSPYAWLGICYTIYARGFHQDFSSKKLVVMYSLFVLFFDLMSLQKDMQTNPRSQIRGCPLRQECPCMTVCCIYNGAGFCSISGIMNLTPSRKYFKL